MRKPLDWFTRAVDVQRAKSKGAPRTVLLRDEVIMLLRREHAAVVRLVKAKRLVQWERGRSTLQEGYLRAYDDLLTALTARGRGKG